MKIFIKDIFLYIIITFAIISIASCNEKKQFDGYLYPIRENGLYGYIDSVGNRIIEPEFLWVSIFHNGLAMAVVDTIYRVVPDSMAYEVGERDTIINVYRMYAKYGYIDKTGRFVIEPKFITYINIPTKGYVVEDMDNCNNALYRHVFRNNRAMFYDTITLKSGYIDKHGDIIISPIYYYSEPFSQGRAVVKDNVGEPLFFKNFCITASKLRCAYIDTIGNTITDFKFEKLSKFNGRCGIGSFKEVFNASPETIGGFTEHNYIIDSEGNLGKDLGFWDEFYGFSRDGISVTRQVMHLKVYDGMQNYYSFIDEDGNYLKPLKGLTDNQLDSLGRCNDIMEVLPEDADIAEATYFNDGFAGISPDGNHWFIIDKYLIIHGYGEESIFEGFRAFSNGLAAVKRNSKWGFINRKIREQIPCKYDSCGFVYPYLEEVFEYDIQGNIKKKAYINRNDSLVWESPLYTNKVDNRYSIKDSKDWGKWTYEYNPIKKYLIYLIIGAVVALIVTIAVSWRFASNRSSKVENPEVLTLQKGPVSDEAADGVLSNTNENESNEILSWPTVGQYAEVIKASTKSPDEYFDKLKHLRPVLDSNGEPIMSSGNFAVVFKMKDEYGKQYAVRCFHRAQQEREKNYKLICDELAKVSSPYLSPIRYCDKELFVESDEYPVLLMDWVDGMTLDKYIRKIIDDKKTLRQLTDNFRKLAIWLLNQPFAHGDLKPDNILVKDDGSLVLVDYDGMFVPAMQGQRAREIGSPDFRNPSRTEDDFNKDIDSFPIVSILLSLELLVENKEYLSQYGAEDRLLFSEEDYRNIDKSMLYKRAYSTCNEDVSELALMLKSQLHCNCDKNLISFLQEKEKRDRNKKANERIENRINATIVIYNLLVPLSVFFYSRFERENNWNLMGVSIVVLISAILLFLIIAIFDIFRPYKKHHLYVDEDYTSWGCIFTLFDFLIPMRGLMSSYYEGPWYYTLLIIAIWICFFNIVGAIVSGAFELRNKIFMTSSEKNIQQEEREKEIIRSEIRKEDERREKELKEMKEKQRRYSNFDDLPF